MTTAPSCVGSWPLTDAASQPATSSASATWSPWPDEVDRATDVAVAGLRRVGYSWAEIASRLGITRQAAQLRWGSTAA